MKCPKCGYLGFEHVDRCRNCGYDFSLTVARSASDLPMRTGTGDLGQPFDDLALVDASARTASPAPRRSARDVGNEERVISSASELPLFGSSGADDIPLITRPSPPRTPLAVRRATPEVPRLRADTPRTPMLDLASPEPELDTRFVSARVENRESPKAVLPPPAEAAGIAPRVLAVGIDVLVLAAVDAAVVYFTMQICGVSLADIGVLPRIPLVAFLGALNAAYFVTFTAGGQTLGKMATGIRVVADDRDAAPDVVQAVIRTAVWVALAVPAGLGFLTAVFGDDRRGFHDRCAGTRVVRAAS